MLSRYAKVLGLVGVSLLFAPAANIASAKAAPPVEPAIPLIFSLESTGTVQTDGLGNYVDGEDTVAAHGHYQSHNGYHLSVDQGHGTQRKVRYDLSSPVPGGGGTAIAPFLDKTADFAAGVFLNVAVGETKAADLHLFMTVNKKSYRLSFGDHPNVPGEQGLGTTLTQVTRINESTWQVVLPAGGVGRLWNIAGNNEVDLGLFNQQFSFTFFLK